MNRLILGAVGILLAGTANAGALLAGDYQQFLVTADAPGSHVVSGTTAFGVDTSGVARLQFDKGTGLGFRGNCTGSLLAGGTSVLTAAHCVTDQSGNVDVLDIQATWDTATGMISQTSATVHVHPSWQTLAGTALSEFDIAIIEFATPIDERVARYEIYEGDSEIGVTGVKVGYGHGGHGPTGVDINNHPAGTKRAGLNMYDADARPVNVAAQFTDFPFPQLGNSLIYDFDTGDLINNTLGEYGLPATSDTGFGDDEVYAVGGDSGGPTFIQDLDSTWRIAGVTSYGYGFTVNPPDTTPTDNLGSFGEVGIDMRVSAYRSFISPFTSTEVPEPGTLGMLLIGVLALGLRRMFLE